MADILLRGIEIPKNEQLTITITPDGKVFRAFIPGSYGEATYLPEGHGRLGDLNALYAQLHNQYHGAISDSDIKVYEALGMISSAPTIVPAEGDSEK